MFFKPLSKSSWWLPYVFIITVHPVALKPVHDATLHSDVVFIFGSHQEAFDGIASSVMHLYPMFVTYFLHTFTANLLHMVESCRVCFGLWCCWHILFFLVLVLWVPWSCSSPYWGPRWGTYFQSGPFVDVFLLHLVAVGLNIQLWSYDVRCSPHCIWLQWCGGYPTPDTNRVLAGFLYTFVLKLPSKHGVTKVSKRGMDPSSLLSSIVNWIFSSMELIWLMKLSFCVFLMITKVSSTNHLHRLEGVGDVLMPFSSNASMYRWAIMRLRG